MIKNFLPAIAIGALSSAAVAVEKPNVLFIAIDDLRPELGCYGSSQVKSPNIDKFASTGTVFSRAYCQVPVCGASRACLLTGVLPTRNRFTTFSTRADKDVPNAPTLPELFKKAGYTTISNGKIFHHKDDTDNRSWSEPAWVPEDAYRKSFDPETIRRLSKRKRGRIFESPDVADNAYPDGKIAEKTINDLKRLKKVGKPFFLACGFIRPHLPFYAPKKYWDFYKRGEIEIADNRYRPKGAPDELRGSGEFRSYHLADFEVNSEKWHRMMRHGYMASVSYVDKLVGDVLAELDRLGMADNTIVVLWGDHGWHLGEHNFWGKHNTMHLAMRVPLIVKAPGKKGGNSKALVETIDILPTLCSLADLKVPDTAQGQSFTALLNNPDQDFHDVAYSRFGRGDAVITKGFTYTSYGEKGEMLYDLEKDPEENENVFKKPEYKETLKKMKKLLKQRKDEAAQAKAGKTQAPSSSQKK